VADLWAFDFDGTLVETATIKREAFFEVFADRHADVVDAALIRWPDASRHDVIPRMVAAAGDAALDADGLIDSYGATVVDRVRHAPAIDGVEDALEWAAHHGVACVFSMTPHAELDAALRARGWDRWLADIRGHPARKPDTLADWIVRFGAGAVTVIGDGESDAEAARLNDACFLPADAGWPLRLTEGVRT
jgi:phosphoglycolate phosphatase-like HAD superfamily hydrolase